MKKRLFPLLAAVALTALTACGGGEVTPVDLSIVPNPVSMTGYSKGANATAAVKTRIDAKLAPEEYTLDIRKGRISITGGSEAGVFWARQTLAQIEAQCGEELPGVRIQDKPAFSYRGAHLDCCRHFFTVEEVKSFLDMMALHKLNVFHWHLTEDQGWRAVI